MKYFFKATINIYINKKVKCTFIVIKVKQYFLDVFNSRKAFSECTFNNNIVFL